MIRLRQACGWCVAAFAAGQCAIAQSPAPAATNFPAPQKIFSAPVNLPLPPRPSVKSPVDFFRELLAMTPVEQEKSLTNRPLDVRDRILAKLREYAALDPDERELRLRATELRWYLLPLLYLAPTNRAARLAAIPEDMRPLVRSRLQRWDILPPPLQREFFESERTLRYFTRVDSSSQVPLPPLPPNRELPSGSPGSNPARRKALSEGEREKMAARFNQFFELTAAEKKKTLNTLSNAERQQMEKTLKTFGELPPGQRLQCIRAFTEFAGMSVEEKTEFLKNAQRWSQMSPKERQAWRDLVSHVPEWPPVPMPPRPTRPPQLTQRLPSLAVTNPN
jgi:hypothetical protein